MIPESNEFNFIDATIADDHVDTLKDIIECELLNRFEANKHLSLSEMNDMDLLRAMYVSGMGDLLGDA